MFEQATKAGPDLASATVLVIDDELVALKFSQKILENIGIGEVLTATGGGQALELLGQRDGPVDLIITDIEMPDMDGYSFVRRLRFGTVPQFKDVPVIMLTGHYDDDHTKKATAHRVQGFLVKPPSVQVMKVEVEKVLADAA